VIPARWALYVSALGVIGAFGATLLRVPAPARVIAVARRLALWLLASSAFMLVAEVNAWFGADGFRSIDPAWRLVALNVWGRHWRWLASTSLAVALALPLAARFPSSWIVLSGMAALGVAAVVPLVGHGGSHDAWLLGAHAAHLFGGGLWIGTLWVALWSGRHDLDALLVRLRSFAPIALTGASLVAASGAVIAWEHLQPLSTLWTTVYGQVLLFKVAAVMLVGGLGFLNWRGVRLKTVVVEALVAAVVVVALAACLSETEPPPQWGHHH